VATLLDRPEFLPREAAFLDASYRAVRFRRRLTGALAIGLLAAMGGIYLGFKLKAQHDLTAQLRAFVNQGSSSLSRARAKNEQTEQLRQLAFSLFDSKHVEQGEGIWTKAGESAIETDKLYREADHALEAAVALGKSSSTAKSLLADVLYERALLAERDGKTDAREEFIARLALYDDGTRQAKWTAPGTLEIDSLPAGAEVTIQQYKERDKENPVLETVLPNLTTPIQHLQLPQGSYLLLFSAPERANVRFPILVRRSEVRKVSLDLPLAASVPKGFVYIPPGPFLFGSSQERSIRKDFFNTVPLHEVTTEGYLIAEHESTFGDWLEYLDMLSPTERSLRASAVGSLVKDSLLLKPVGQDWELTLQIASNRHVVRLGNAFRISERKVRQDQDWRLLPMVGVSPVEVQGYLSWLQISRNLFRPRLCTEVEWERAARGADGREFPHGDYLSPTDANFDETYEKNVTAMGPDEVGAHPNSRSPFGIEDMCGNVLEFTASSLKDGEYVLRGGGFHLSRTEARTINRQAAGLQKTAARGFRVCADLMR
jgi:formylglycine-generating enzyme required for sulfatase activity